MVVREMSLYVVPLGNYMTYASRCLCMYVVVIAIYLSATS